MDRHSRILNRGILFKRMKEAHELVRGAKALDCSMSGMVLYQAALLRRSAADIYMSLARDLYRSGQPKMGKVLVYKSLAQTEVIRVMFLQMNRLGYRENLFPIRRIT